MFPPINFPQYKLIFLHANFPHYYFPHINFLQVLSFYYLSPSSLCSPFLCLFFLYISTISFIGTSITFYQDNLFSLSLFISSIFALSLSVYLYFFLPYLSLSPSPPISPCLLMRRCESLRQSRGDNVIYFWINVKLFQLPSLLFFNFYTLSFLRLLTKLCACLCRLSFNLFLISLLFFPSLFSCYRRLRDFSF